MGAIIMDSYYFAYGSNMNPNRMSERGVLFDSVQMGLLMHYRFRSNKISKLNPTMGFTNVEPFFDGYVFGVLYKLNQASDLSVLDRKEGYPNHYQKTVVPVHTRHGMTLAMTYVATLEWCDESDLTMAPEYTVLIESGLEFCQELHLSERMQENATMEPYVDNKTDILFSQFEYYKNSIWKRTKM